MEESLNILKEYLKTAAKEQNFENYVIKINPISTGGANFTGYLFKVEMTEPGKDDLKLFAKVAAMGEKLRNRGAQSYKIESFFYNQLVRKFRAVEDKHKVSETDRLLVPKFFGCSNEYMKEVLLLEDLTTRGFEPFDRFKSITWEQASKSVEQLAKFHALSIALSCKDLEAFEATKHIFSDPGKSCQIFKTFLANIIPRIVETIRDEDRERIAKFMNYSLNDEKFKCLLTPIKRLIIIHGDYRPNNVMFKQGTCEAIPLDFQTLRFGSPSYDLLYFINLGSDNEFRHKYFQATIDHYYSELCAALRRLDVDPDAVYSKDDFEFEYKEVLPFTVLVSLCVLLLVTVDEESAPTELKDLDLDSYGQFTPNQRFKEKLNELIEFYDDLGVFF